MAEAEGRAPTAEGMRGSDRVATLLLLGVMAIGAFAMWIAVPLFCMWWSSKVTSSAETQYLVALPATVLGVALVAMVLGRLNGLYLRLTGALARYEAIADADFEPGHAPKPPTGPLEPLIVVSLVVAIFVFVVWFFVFAENPPYVPL